MRKIEPDAAGFVLAGGRSTRMGEDKALVEIGGRPLIAHALEVLGGAGMEARIAGARSDLNSYAGVIADEERNRGPLGGVVSALAQSREEWAVFVSIDMPLMAPELVGYLVEDARRTNCAVTVASISGFAQTFPAVVRGDAEPGLRRELEQGSGGCFAAFAAAARGGGGMRVIAAEALAQAGQVTDPRGFWPYQWFLNVNSPGELERASAILEARIG